MKNNKLLTIIWQNIQRKLTVAPNEPYVQQKKNRFGDLYWQVYDRKTNQSHTFGSERDVKFWIEERYHI